MTPTPASPPTRPMNFLVVVPKFTSSPAQDYIFPVGIGYIVACLKQHGFSVQGIDLNRFAAPPQEVLARVIREQSIDVVATGTISAHYDKVKAVLEGARQAQPRIVTVLGGGVMSSEPEAMMDALEPHFGVLGEGEVTMVELARELSTTRNFTGVNGLIFREPDGRVTTTPARAPIKDLDQLPLPDEGLLEDFYKTQPPVYNIVGSRSCPYKCTFCYHPIGDLYRQRSMDDIFKEIEFSYHKFTPFHYRVIDELFSVKRERVLEFCQRIKPYHVNWDVQMRVTDPDPEMLDAMRDAGCRLVSYGLESGSQAILESMRKHTKIPDLVRAVDMTYSARLQVQGNYIFGDPAESADSATETFSLWLKQRKVGINMIPIEVYPGTPLYKGAVKNGLIPDPTTYISGGCRSLNLMKMPERDALQLMLLMYLLVNTYGRVPGRILDCQPGQLVGNKDGEQTQLFNLKVHCPHCEKEVAYRDMPMYAAQRWVCPECNRRYDLQPLCQWRQAPASYELFDDFQFEEAHAAEMRRFLRQENWRDTRANMPGFLGVRLFGVHYLLPSNLTLDHIRYSMMRVFVADVEQKRLDPLVVCDCDYSNLHHPYYLTHRVAKLVEQWQGRNCTVAVAGAGAETSNLLKMTNLSQSRLTGFLPLEANDTAISGLGHPVLNLKRMVDNPPNVLLVSTVRNQRAFCEFFAGTLTRLGVEVVALYESGSHY